MPFGEITGGDRSTKSRRYIDDSSEIPRYETKESTEWTTRKDQKAALYGVTCKEIEQKSAEVIVVLALSRMKDRT